MPDAYKATFSMERWYDVPNNWVECEGIRLESNIAIRFIEEMCRALKTAGKPDGPIVFYQEHIDVPTFSSPSINEVIERADNPPAPITPRRPAAASPVKPLVKEPPLISEALFLALTEVKTDPRNWCTLHGRTRGVLLDRGYVSGDSDVLKLTSLAQQAMTAYRKSKAIFPGDLATASEDELREAATIIGLKLTDNVFPTLKSIENTAAGQSLENLEQAAGRLGISMRFGRASETMKKRRILAAIANMLASWQKRSEV